MKPKVNKIVKTKNELMPFQMRLLNAQLPQTIYGLIEDNDDDNITEESITISVSRTTFINKDEIGAKLIQELYNQDFEKNAGIIVAVYELKGIRMMKAEIKEEEIVNE